MARSLEEITQLVKEIVEESADVEVTSTSEHLASLGIDSLDKVVILQDVEDKFEIDIDIEEEDGLVSVDTIAALVLLKQ